MTKFIITTESGSDITPELQQLYNVYLVPMHVTLGDQTYPDGSISVAETFAYYDQTGQLTKTSGTAASSASASSGLNRQRVMRIKAGL